MTILFFFHRPKYDKNSSLMPVRAKSREHKHFLFNDMSHFVASPNLDFLYSNMSRLVAPHWPCH